MNYQFCILVGSVRLDVRAIGPDFAVLEQPAPDALSAGPATIVMDAGADHREWPVTLAHAVSPGDVLLTLLTPAAELGRRGGGRNTPAQQAARLRNSKLGGWPKGRPRGPRKPPTGCDA